MKIAFIGYLPEGEVAMGGAEVKTKTLLRAIRQSHKIDVVKVFNTHRWQHKAFRFLFYIFDVVLTCDHIIVVSSTGSLFRLLTVLQSINLLQRPIHFVPVGLCKIEKRKLNVMRRLKGIYVQTEYNKEMLDSCGLNNVYVMHNFKYLNMYQKPYVAQDGVYKFCYFARVTPEKGIVETIKVVNEINKNGIICHLDIFGKIDQGFEETFFALVNECSEYIEYCGVADPNKIPEIMKDYFMVIFPTRFYGEGFPGTILDAFAAGVPVLSSRFASFDNILIDEKNCLAFDFGDYDEMQEKMIYAMNNAEKVNSMRAECNKEYKKYSPEQEIKVLLNLIC